MKSLEEIVAGLVRTAKAEKYKREKAKRKQVAASKVGPSGMRRVGPGDQATRGRGRGTRSRP